MSRSKGKLAKRLVRLENQHRKDMIRLRREVFSFVNHAIEHEVRGRPPQHKLADPESE